MYSSILRLIYDISSFFPLQKGSVKISKDDDFTLTQKSVPFVKAEHSHYSNFVKVRLGCTIAVVSVELCELILRLSSNLC